MWWSPQRAWAAGVDFEVRLWIKWVGLCESEVSGLIEKDAAEERPCGT